MNRDKNLDLYKGVLIILVILGHAIQFGFGPQYRFSELFYDDFMFRAIYTFHMPLFMTISGFLFYYSNSKSYQSVILSKIKYIGIPFLSYFVIIYGLIFYFANADSFYFIDFINKMRINMWFLSSLLLNCMIVSSTVHFFKKRELVYLVFAFIFVLFHVLSDDIIPSHHKFMFFYFLVGYWCCNKFGVFFICNKVLLVSLLSLLFIFTLFIFDKELFVYGSGLCIIKEGRLSLQQLFIDIIRYVIGIVNGLCFCSVLVLLNKYRWFSKISDYLLHLGNNTLAIYGVQSIAFILISELLELHEVCIPYNYVIPIAWVIIVIIISELFILVSDKSKLCRFLFLGRK